MTKKTKHYLGHSILYSVLLKKKTSPSTAATVKRVGLQGGELQGTHEVTCRGTKSCLQGLHYGVLYTFASWDDVRVTTEEIK